MIEIRPATREDWVEILSLYQQANDEIEAEHGRGVSMALLVNGVEHALNNYDAAYVAWDTQPLGAVPVGVVVWTHTPLCKEGVAVGFGTYVKPAFRRQGVASMLRDCAAEHCRQKGYRTIEGIAGVTNVAGLRSAISDGFNIVGYLVEKKL
jgi:L-amino acid N-acyltransferase YncA